MNNNMYLVNAPAGSGKTTFIENKILSLVEEFPHRKTLCITYTNRAKNELLKRVNSKNVTIETIHAFLPQFILSYNTKKEVIELYFNIYKSKLESMIAKGESDEKNIRYIEKFGTLSIEEIKKNITEIKYNEQPFSSYYYGRLSHDDIILFSLKMFEAFPILYKRLHDKYDYIFIDEYQDTSCNALNIFYNAVKGTNSKLYLLGDKMQEIFDNYDGNFEEELETFDDSINLQFNFRCQEKIVSILNKLYNNDNYTQIAGSSYSGNIPKIIISNDNTLLDSDDYSNFMQLFVFNRSRFDKIGAGNLFASVSSMAIYRFPSKYSATDVLLDKTSDNPDYLFRYLFNICDLICLCKKKLFGQAIQFIRRNTKIFDKTLVNINKHEDKVKFYNKIKDLMVLVENENLKISELVNFLEENNYCNKDLLKSIFENVEYNQTIDSSFKELLLIFDYLDNQFVSTQHGVKGEGHDNVCFVAEDSNRSPITHIYKFFELFAVNNINLTDFQSFYYDYINYCNLIDTSIVKPRAVFETHKNYYIQKATELLNKFQGNIYFDFLEKSKYIDFINTPNTSNATSCFKVTSTKGTLWAYKLFYVGCSRAKRDLVVFVNDAKIQTFKEQFILKMESIGFEVVEYILQHIN